MIHTFIYLFVYSPAMLGRRGTAACPEKRVKGIIMPGLFIVGREGELLCPREEVRTIWRYISMY